MTSETAYRLYGKYVAQLHDALARPTAGPPVAEAYRVRHLSRSEFDTVWQGWGSVPGLRERWAARFSAGYEADAESIRRRFSVALAGRGTDRDAA